MRAEDIGEGLEAERAGVVLVDVPRGEEHVGGGGDDGGVVAEGEAGPVLGDGARGGIGVPGEAAKAIEVGLGEDAAHPVAVESDIDNAAAKALARQASAIGRGLRMIVASLSPSVILVAGDVTAAWHRFGPAIEREVARLTLAGAPPQIRPTHGTEVSRLRGAAALIFQRPALSEVPVSPAFVSTRRAP